MLLREHRYLFAAGSTTHIFRIEELIRGLELWPHRFRLKISASSRWEAQTFYGASCQEAAEKAADFLAACLGEYGPSAMKRRSIRPRVNALKPLQIQEST